MSDNRVNELRQKNFGIKNSLTSAKVINFGKLNHLHGPEVKISIELGAEFNIWCRSSQLVAEVNPNGKIHE